MNPREEALKRRWDQKANGKSFSLELLRAGKKYWWMCPKGHSWYATGAKITATNGCPYCANRSVLTGFNDLATTHPSLLTSWDYEANEVSPKGIFAGSRAPRYWRCSRCEGGWRVSPYARAQGNGCPYCANKKLLAGFNDVKTLYPRLAEEWDGHLNPEGPENYISGSHAKVHWLCPFNHSWLASIKHRVNGTGCPTCAILLKSSREEQELLDFIQSILEPAHAVISGDRTVLSGKELDMLIPSLQKAVEFNGDYWHSDERLSRKGFSATEYHLGKLTAARENGVELCFVWQRDWRQQRKAVETALRLFLRENVKSPLLEQLS